ncbi:MAG: sigma-54 dependent transcriptional regulator [Pseudomonadota bacterium]
MSDDRTLLIVEDTPSLARTYQSHLKAAFDTIQIAETGAAALSMVQVKAPSCVLLGLNLPDMSGMDLLKTWIDTGATFPIIVITANGSMSVAIEAMRMGASDFVVKPTSKDRLRETVNAALDQARRVTSISAPTTKSPTSKETPNFEDQGEFCGFIGRSLPMQAVYRMIESAAPSKAHIFITGETGTGKEVAARAVHSLSPRRRAKFVPVNCGAIPNELIESELFGHVKGAFTGATGDRVGAAQLADGGTLFLDELGEMPIDMQPKLLRFIQTGEYSRVGESVTRRADIRIVAATNRDPLQAVQDGKLREDLYYRLHVIPVALPPLRERGADILILARAFLKKFAAEEGRKTEGLERSAEEWLVDQAWPGNVRQLENLMRQAAVLVREPKIDRQALSQLSPNNSHENRRAPIASLPAMAALEDAQPSSGGIEPLWLTEKLAIERAIALCDGSITAAARLLEVSPSTIYRKREAWETNDAA